MARRVFISFRFSDGTKYKDALSSIFDQSTEVINCSEDVDRSGCSDLVIKNFLYLKLRSSSVTIVLLTPDAVNHMKNWRGQYDDWMYDEIRYSLEDRENNRCNGLVAVYTKEAENLITSKSKHICSICNKEQVITSISEFDNLVRRNLMNVKPLYKKTQCAGVYDRDVDSYCSLISWDEFIKDYQYFIDMAAEKREHTYKYDIKKHLQ